MESVKQFFVDQVTDYNGYLVVAALCFTPLAALLLYISFPLVELIVQFQLDNGYSTLTIEQWLNAIPLWAADLMHLCELLITLLSIWIVINIIHYPAVIIYDAYREEQAEKYPLEH